MSKPDPPLMRARVRRVEGERPDIDHAIVKGLYEHFVDVHGRQPALDEFREYVDEITSNIEWLDLRERFTPRAPTIEERATLLDGVASTDLTQGAPTRRGRGRPRGTRSVSRQQIVDTYRSLRRAYGRRPTQAELAMNLEPRIAKRTLQGHLVHYGLPWPPE